MSPCHAPPPTTLPPHTASRAAVRDKIVDALYLLYVKGWDGATFTSAQAAKHLVDLATGATLGELGALEEVGGVVVYGRCSVCGRQWLAGGDWR